MTKIYKKKRLQRAGEEKVKVTIRLKKKKLNPKTIPREKFKNMEFTYQLIFFKTKKKLL